MATSWSDPNPSGPNAAQLGNAARIDNANIGGIVASILESRARQRALQQQQFNQMLAIAERGAQEYRANQREGSANDAANAAIYGIQNPSDPYGGYADSNRVPDYGGSDALRALESARMMQPDLYESADQKALRAAQLDLIRSEAYNSWRGAGRYGNQGNDGGYDAADVRRQQIIDTQALKDARNEASEAMGVTGPKLYAALAALHGYKPGVNSFPEIGDNAAISTADQGDYKDRVLAAAKAYEDKVSAIRGRSSTTLPAPTTQAAPGVRQADVDQAKQAMDDEAKRPKGATPAPANTGIAASREQAPVGGYYRAPDGSIRRRSN